jgi:hypothetical protein
MFLAKLNYSRESLKRIGFCVVSELWLLNMAFASVGRRTVKIRSKLEAVGVFFAYEATRNIAILCLSWRLAMNFARGHKPAFMFDAFLVSINVTHNDPIALVLHFPIRTPSNTG